tara:strand:- start:14789 stop:15007 length:219 start_codon:yes stop_codon:yes gene_type:complete
MILEALRKKYESDIASARANIQVYIDNPAGIGEHPDLVSAVDEQVTLLAEAEDKLSTLEMNYLDNHEDYSSD